MNLDGNELAKSFDLLIKASSNFERQLEKDGITEAHEFGFATREMLYDLKRLNLMLGKVMSTSDTGNALPAFYETVKAVLYEFLPHIEGHMNEIEGKLAILMPENTSTDDE